MLQSHITKKMEEGPPRRSDLCDDYGLYSTDDTDMSLGDADRFRDYSGDAANTILTHVIRQMHEFDDLGNGLPER